MNNDFKKFIVGCFYDLPLCDSLKDYNLIVLTSSGVVIGSPIIEDDPEDSAYDMSKTVTNFYETYKLERNIDTNEFLPGNQGFIALKNVTIKSGNATYSMPFLTLFYEDIIGITIGKI